MKKPSILGTEPAFETLLPINRPTLPPLKNLLPELEEIFASGILTNAKYVKQFEKECADYLGTKRAVAVSCCTDGLILTIKALGLTGEVIVPSFTFPASVHALIWNNIKPVFVDCDPETFNINPELIEEKITPRTTGIMAVYIFGNPPQMERLEQIAQKHGLKLISDAAHAFGTKYNGKGAGNFGDAEIFSLAPTKVIVSGEGGIVGTNNEELAKQLSIARDYGHSGNYNCTTVGLNARMSEIHAILGLKCLKMLEENLNKRYKIIETYKTELGSVPGISFQKIPPQARSTFNYFSILVDEKEFGLTNDELAKVLGKDNIMTRKYFFPPVHTQQAYAAYFEQYKDALPATASVCRRICCLPLFSHLPEDKVKKVCEVIKQVHHYSDEIKAQLRGK